MLDFGRFSNRIIATRELAGRAADYAPFPSTLHPRLAAALETRGIRSLYSHQAEMYLRAMHGEDVVITTGTASGKSLAFLLPVLQVLIADPAARAILIYPTKALAQDQLRSLLRFTDDVLSGGGLERRLEAGVYDGDTPPQERTRIRERAQLILTNPDMLNAGFLPAHGRQGYSHLFANVRAVVIDEMHTYRGAFGAHMANVMRRLLRICAHYKSHPQFLCSSATIANPVELANKLCHRSFGLVHRDGSPSAGRVVHFWQPPLLDSGTRRGVAAEMAAFVPHLVTQRHKSIAFCRSRKETEVVLKEARDRLARVDRHHNEGDFVAAYRAGYTPKERRAVEEGLLSGKLLSVVSTSALELGIDVGALEVVAQAGYPGSRASFWQQIGRAGRRGKKAVAVLMLAQTPEDQFIAASPDWLTGQPAEHAVVDPDNLTVALAHVRCAAAELPLTLDDCETWPDLGELVPVLEQAGELTRMGAAWQWTGGPFPAGDFSLRNTDRDRFKVVNRTTGETLTEMTRPQVYREAHTRAVYLHDGEQYLVEELDLVGHKATVVPVQQNFYTQPDVRTHIDVLVTSESRSFGRTVARFGDVRVDDTVVGYKMLEFHNHQNLGYEALRQDLALTLETEAVWWEMPPEVLDVLRSHHPRALAGLVSSVRAIARMRTMAEAPDLSATTFSFTHELTANTRVGLVAYDNHPGGIGFAAKAYDLSEEILRSAHQLVANCPCSEGCPACVGDTAVSKQVVTWALQSFFEHLPLPEGVFAAPSSAGAGAANDDGPVSAPLCALADLPARWTEVKAMLRGTAHTGGKFLARASAVRVAGSKIVFTLSSPEATQWLMDPTTQDSLLAVLKQVVELPADARIVGEVPEEHGDSAARKHLKARRRMEDFQRPRPQTEQGANKRLASGFLLPHERPKPE
jgi:DEAD/DEAH box helicase domain-containing protein